GHPRPGRREAGVAARAVRGRGARRPQLHVQHRAHRGGGAVLHARSRPDDRAVRLAAARVPRRAPAHRPPQAGRRRVPEALARLPERRRPAPDRVRPRHHHPLAPRPAGVREVAAMPETVTLAVARYRPETESEPTVQTYEVPFRKDWVVLDALNYIKDRLDGSLSFRWSCRMGVCGGCGMTVK